MAFSISSSTYRKGSSLWKGCQGKSCDKCNLCKQFKAQTQKVDIIYFKDRTARQEKSLKNKIKSGAGAVWYFVIGSNLWWGAEIRCPSGSRNDISNRTVGTRHSTASRFKPVVHFVLKMGHSRPLFIFITVFLKLIGNKIADDWTRTADLRCRKEPLPMTFVHLDRQLVNSLPTYDDIGPVWTDVGLKSSPILPNVV